MTSEQTATSELAQLPVAPSQVRQAALQELDSLGSFVAGLSIADWEKPSAAVGWTIGEVVAHLNLAIGLYSRVLDAGLAGRGSGSAWRAFGDLTKRIGPSASPAFNAINNALPRLVEGTLSPETIKGQFAASSRKFRERVERVGPADYTRPMHYMGRPWPLSFFLAAIVNELAIHGWDMRSKLDPDAYLGHDARQVLPWFWASGTPTMFHPSTELRGTVQLRLDDPDLEAWWTIDPAGVRQGVGLTPNPEVTIRGETSTLLLVLSGRIPVGDALNTTSLRVEGAESLAHGFLGAWRII